jgi:hypothetical protein
MNLEAARLAIVALTNNAAAAFGTWTVQVDWENRDLVNYAAQAKPFVAMDIVYYDGKQKSLGPNPWVGSYGYIALAVCIPEGKGTSEGNQLMSHMANALQLKLLPAIQTEVARPQPSVPRKGWYCMVTLINFSYHEPT